MFTIKLLGQTCECGRLPTCREVYWTDLELWDRYCEACFIWHCWRMKQHYVPWLNPDVKIWLEWETEALVLEEKIIALYKEGKISFPAPQIVRQKGRPAQIVRIIEETPGITAHELRNKLGYRGQSSLYRHITPLVKNNTIRLERSLEDGRKVGYYIAT